VEMRLATPDDLQEIGRLLPDLAGLRFQERFPERTVVDFCRWKYDTNPLGRAAVGVAVEGGRVMSIVAGVPKLVQVGSEILLAFEFGDFITVRAFRRQGLFSSLIRLVCDEAARRGAAFAYVRPNENSFPILTMGLSFAEVQSINECRYVVPSGLIHRKAGVSPELLRALGVDWLARRLFLPSSAGSVIIEPVNRFGKEMDKFWERTRRRYSFLVVRDSRYLNWRYSDSPTPYLLWVAHRSGIAAGYLTALMNRSQTEGQIIDLFCHPEDGETAAALLRAGMETMLNAGVQSIWTWIPQATADSVGQRLLKRAFPRRTKPNLHMVMRFLDTRLNASLLPSSGWHIAMGDFDGV
jgi:hypothetical protein